MVDSHGRSTTEESIAPGTQQKIAFWVAGTICAIVIGLAILIAMRTPLYEAQTRLAYNPAGIPLSDAGLAAGTGIKGAATTAAVSALTDAQLAQVIDRFDLYPALRHKQSTAVLTGRLRENLTFTEPQPGILQVAFRDADQLKTTAVTNGLASVLATYQVMSSVPVPQSDVAVKSKRQAKAAKTRSYQGQSTPPPVAVVPAPVLLAAPSTSAANPEYVAELMRQVDRVNAALTDMQTARNELETEQKQVASKIEGLEKAERRAAEARGGAKPEAVRSERAVAEQDLAVEKAKLASLRERYTDAYPDVQSTQDDIAKIQAKLAALPATPAAGEKMAPTADQIEAMEKLRVERMRVERDLDQNQISMSGETQRKMNLLAQVEQAKTRRQYPAAAQVVTPAPAPIVTPVAPAVASDAAQPVMMNVPVLPFRVIETAGSAALITTSRLALGVWLALGAVVLLALCFVPMVPAHYAAVVTTPEDLQHDTPEHAVYLGDVGRTEP